MKTEFLKQQEFLNVYSDFDKWLLKLGFKLKNSSTNLDYHYSFYNEKIDDLYSVEHYVNEILGISIRFLRDKNVHKFLIINGLGDCADPLTLEEFKEEIKNLVIKIRDEKLAELEFFNTL